VNQHTSFCCNLHAFNPEERTRHKELTNKLLRIRQKTAELEHGYEFSFDGGSTSLAELAEWVAAESKCCPFFDFHIASESHGKLLRLRLTGADGVKPFIRAEFRLEAK
jgi:hypothetical protein